MADYHMEHLVPELNLAAARLAREAADEATAQNPDKPRFVAGVLGPTSRTATISPDVNDPGFRNVTFDQLRVAYLEAIDGLVKGGVDILMVETDFRHAQRQGRAVRHRGILRRATICGCR